MRLYLAHCRHGREVRLKLGMDMMGIVTSIGESVHHKNGHKEEVRREVYVVGMQMHRYLSDLAKFEKPFFLILEITMRGVINRGIEH